MSNNQNEVAINMVMDIKDYDEQLKKAETMARDTGAKISQELVVKMRLDIDDLQQKLVAAKAKLKAATDPGKAQALRLDIAQYTNNLTEAKRQLNNYINTGDKSLSRLQSKFDGLGTGLKDGFLKVAGVIGTVFAADKFKEFSDIFIGMQNSLRQVAEGPELDTLQKKILKLANDSRVPVDTLTNSFVRYDKVIKAMGGTQAETFTIMDSLSKSLVSTGRTAEEASSVMLQLSQAFGSGKLQGDEFRSLSENMPQIMDILAKSMNVPRGKLKELSSEGKITAEVLKNALIEANVSINEQFSKSQVTISQKLTQIRNDFIIAFGEFDKKSGFTDTIVTGLDAVRTAVGGFVSEFPNVTKWLAIGVTAAAGFGIALSALIPVIGYFTGAVVAAEVGLLPILGTIGLVAGAIALLAGGAYYAADSMGFFNKSVVVTADSIDNYNAKLEALNKKQDETTKKYNEGKIGLDEYNKSIADGKTAIDELNAAHSEVQKGLDITNDKQMAYKDKIIAINKLKLNTSEYDALIKKIQESNGELLKNIRLQQIALKSKMTASMAENVGKAETGGGSTMPVTKQLPGIGLDFTSIGGPNNSKVDLTGVANNIKSITEQADNEMNALKKAEQDIIKATAEAEKLIKEPVKTKGSGTGGDTGGSGSKKKKKTAEELQKELDKIAEEAKKKELERQIEVLNADAASAILRVKNSSMSESEKAKQIVKINEDLNKKVDALKQNSNKTDLDNAKDFIKAEEEKSKKVKEGQGIIQEYYDSIGKGSQIVKDKITELKTQIADLNKELSKSTENKNTDIAQRRLDIMEREKEIQKEIEKMKTDGVNMNFVDSIPQSMLSNFPSGSMIGGISVEDIQKAKDLQKELADLQAEQIKNTFVLDQKTFDDLQAYKNLTKTEQILADFETEKADIEAKLKLKQDALTAEETQLKSLDLIKRNIESTFTAFLKTQTTERITELDKLKQAALDAVAALKEAGIAKSDLASGSSTSTTTVAPVINQTNNFSAKITPTDVKNISNQISKGVANAATGIK